MSKNTVQATGARASVAIGEESIWGEAVNPTHALAFTSEGLSASEETLESEAIRGDRGRHNIIPGVLDISGDISFEQAASGFGMLIRHTLGDYIKAPNCDGGVHGRMEDDVLTAVGEDTDRGVLPLAKEHSGGFLAATGTFAVVDRAGANNSLRFDKDATGYEYDTYTRSERSHVHSVTPTDSDHPEEATTGGASITIYPIARPDGSGYDVPEFNDNGGLLEIGPSRRKVKYTGQMAVQVTIGGGNVDTVKLFLDTNDVPADNTGTNPVEAGDFVFGFAGFAWADVSTVNANLVAAKGSFVYEYEETEYNGVFTHHIERGRYLPEGLTVEVDRDAAVFMYTGCKGSSFTWSFETNSIVTATSSLLGQKEHAMATLVEDVLPATSPIGDPDDVDATGYILIENAEAFPNPADAGRTEMDAAEITIGERTGIYYNEKVLAGAGDGKGYTDEDEVYKLVLSNADGTIDSGANAQVEMFHPAGSNVDNRTPRVVADPVTGKDDPLTSFESMVYIDGYYEEVLSGEVSLENNLNADKYGLGSKNRLAVIAEQAEVSATLTMEFDDGKHYNRFKNGSFFYLEFKCISETQGAEIGATGILPQQYVILPRCKFNGETPVVSDRSFIQSDMPIMAIVDDEYETTDLICILVNGQTEDVEQ